MKREDYGKKQSHKVVEIAPNTYDVSDFGVTDCYLIVGSERALLIDVGTGFGDMRGVVEKITKLPITVVCTHLHPDHIGGKGQFERVYVHSRDLTPHHKLYYTKLARKIMFWGNDGTTIDPEISVKDIVNGPCNTEVLPLDDFPYFDLGDRKIYFENLPGHTMGSIVLWDETTKIFFAGDNACASPWLFLPNAAPLETWVKSAKRLLELSRGYEIYWGHEGGKIERSLVEHVISIAEEYMAAHPKNTFFSRIRFYPSNDRVNGSVVIRTGNLYEKK